MCKLLILQIAMSAAPALSGAPNDRYLGLPTQPHFEMDAAHSSRAALGKRLFFDKHLSGNGEISCATCHAPTRALSDGRSLAVGINGKRGTRNTPTLWDSAYMSSFFWDGRSVALTNQAINPLLNPREQGLRNTGQLLDSIRRSPAYRSAFSTTFGGASDSISVRNVTRALAAYEETLVAGDSPFDRYLYGHETHAMSAAAIRGFELFRGRAGCSSCHTINSRYALFTDGEFHDEGVGFGLLATKLAMAAVRVAHTPAGELDQLITSDSMVAALGRFVQTKDPHDIGKFRTPTLRNVALTAPYMHDGSISTLLQAIDFEIYYQGLHSKRPLILTPNERSDILAFLDELTSPAASNLSSPSNTQRSQLVGSSSRRTGT